MKATLEGRVDLTFIRGGISKQKTPYLQVSNGRSEFFVTIPKDKRDSIDEDTFANYEEDDIITLDVSITAGSDSVRLVDIVK